MFCKNITKSRYINTKSLFFPLVEFSLKKGQLIIVEKINKRSELYQKGENTLYAIRTDTIYIGIKISSSQENKL